MGIALSRYDFDLGQHYHAVDVCGESGGPYYPVSKTLKKLQEQWQDLKVRGHRMEVYEGVPKSVKEQK